MPDDTEQKTRSAASTLGGTSLPGASAGQQIVDRNTQLAVDRTVLAAERTYAAWVRTGLAALASGVGARALLAGTVPAWFGVLSGSALILFSALCFIAAVWRELSSGTPPSIADIQRLPTALLLTINGFLILISLTALVGIWLLKA
jgi:putative membrane protein